MKKEILLDGNRFSTLAEFYDEVEEKLTKSLDWKIGRNLDAYNDVLRGGFGVHDYEEPLKLVWKNSGKSKVDLGYTETINHFGKLLQSCHPSNIHGVKANLENAKNGKGKTLFETIVDITGEHKHIELSLE